MNNSCNYVLITAAYNEEKYITKTIESVIQQTILPERWVIVSDGSTDRTDDIVKEYASRHDFIRFVRREKKVGRNFSDKVLALREGIQMLTDVDYSFFCTLDADVSFDKTYFQAILEKFHKNPRLGIAGGIILDYINDKPFKIIGSLSSVPGAIQFFSRDCYSSTGGYTTSKFGGIDSILEIKAKKQGWEIQSFPELHIHHHRRIGTGDTFPLKARYRNGIQDYCLGNPFLFEFLKCCYRFQEPPYIIGAVAWFCGYLFSCFRKPERALAEEEIAFIRKEQNKRIKNFFGIGKIT